MEKATLLRGTFDEFEPFDPEHGQSKAGKASTTADIDRPPRRGSDQRHRLRRVEHMPAPYLIGVEGPPADQIDAGVPVEQEIHEPPQSLQRFT